MPKREKTPSPSRDEPKYFTVVHPWPGHLDLSLPGDGKKMCRWLAAACGTTDPILSFFYRPDSPGLCIIEVVRDWAEQHARRLLGCHSWQHFLRDNSDTANNATSVFYSHYTSHREVQKMGWKIVDLEDSWFGSRVDRQKAFVSPYPRPTWCPPPAHDTTGYSFCRSLPVSLFPEGGSTSAPTVPVGSEKWTEKRAVNPPAFVMQRESRPTSEPVFSSVYDEDFGPTGDIVESNEPPALTDDLCGDTEGDETTEFISDLARASFGNKVEIESVCPHHGRTCKKGLCEWRAEYAKKVERERGYPKGPSNTKNYTQRPRGGRGRGRGSFSNDGNRSGTQTLSTPAETTEPPRVGGSSRGAAPPGNAWGRGPPAFTNRPSASTTGQGNGTGRGGQPAWAPTRGRKPT